MNLFEAFAEVFNAEPVVVRAPGRINLIGEHTDYNGGLALPAAVDRCVFVAVSRRDDLEIRLFSDGYEPYISMLAALKPMPGQWFTYIEGVAAVLLGGGHVLGGFNMYVSGDIPQGAGMSSSAALCCGVAMALDELFGLGLGRRELAEVAQQAEHRFAGVSCGLMDQYACLFGRKGHALRMDFSSLEFEYVPVELEGHYLVLLDTGVKHSLAGSAYNERRGECARAVELLSREGRRLGSLRGASAGQLFDHVLVRDAVAYKRAKFVLDENARVDSACGLLASGDLVGFGELMKASHQGLRELYQVSCRELDFLQETALAYPAVLGSRMMGGGFGGCTLNLVKKNSSNWHMLGKIAERYYSGTGLELKSYSVSPSDGASVLPQAEARRLKVKAGTDFALPDFGWDY